MFVCNVTDPSGAVIPRWHEERMKGLGASEIATVLGMNPWQTPLELWAQKTGKVKPPEDNDVFWLGRKLEPVVAEFFAKKVGGVDVLEYANGLYRHDVHEWMLATPDFFCAEGTNIGLLQTKTAAAWKKDDWEDGVPSYYLVQIQQEMGVTGKEFAYLACLIGGRELAHHRFQFSKDVFQQLVEAGERFMEFVKSDTPPAPSGKDGESDVLDALCKHTEGETVTLDDECMEFFDAYAKHSEKRKKLEKEAKEAKALEDAAKYQLRMKLGKASFGTCQGRAIRCTLVPGGEYTATRKDYYKVTIK